MRTAILPDWWDESCQTDETLLPDLELRLSRFLGTPLPNLRNPAFRLEPLKAKGAQLRKVKNLDRDRLAPAIHAAIRIAEATIRSLRDHKVGPFQLPNDPGAWHTGIRKRADKVDLAAIAGDLWSRGIPVIHVENLPSPKFQGLACVLQGRPVIVLGHLLDAPARLAFLTAHEGGHIANGDCTADQPVVDENDEVVDPSAAELRADDYARSALGVGLLLQVKGPAPVWKELARLADGLENDRGLDAGSLIWTWANHTQQFMDAQMALAALRLDKGGRRILRSLFRKHVDAASAAETDQALLSCVTGEVGNASAV